MLKAIGYAINDVEGGAEHMAPAALFNERELPLDWITVIYPKGDDPQAHVDQLQNLIVHYSEPLLIVGGGHSLIDVASSTLGDRYSYLCCATSNQHIAGGLNTFILGEEWETLDARPWVLEQDNWVFWLDVELLQQQVSSKLLDKMVSLLELKPSIFFISGYDPYQDHQGQQHGQVCQMIRVFSKVSLSK